MKDRLCEAFCDNLELNQVPAGLAIGTPFHTSDGDKLGFYILGKVEPFTIADDGSVFPTLEASGVDFRSGTRGEALAELKLEYGVDLDEDTQEFRISSLSDLELPKAALRFVAFCLRVRDFMLMTEYRVASSFREDAERMLREVVEDRAIISQSLPVNDDLDDFPADFVLRSSSRRPVAVYLGTSTERLMEAIYIKMKARHETHSDVSIVALLETMSGISARVRQQAMNRLDLVGVFRGDEAAAINRIASEAIDVQHPH